jgi:hypothetical protein
MAMQTDVLASQVRTDDGVLNNQAGNAIGPARVKGVYIVPSGTAGSVVFKNGSNSAATVMTVNTVASATQPTYFILPGEGVRFTSGIYVDVTSIGSVMVFYG